MKDKDLEKFVLFEWLQLLETQGGPIRNTVLLLRRSCGDGLQFLLTRDSRVLETKESIIFAWVLILNLRPPACKGKPVHPWLNDFVNEAMGVGEMAGWEARGFTTSATKLIACSMLLEKILLTLFQMQSHGTHEAMSGQYNCWIRELLMFGLE